MVEVALRRARALTPYVSAEGLAEEALQKLLQSSVLVQDPEDHTRFAPAHDVYEDWALLQWLRRLYEQGGPLNTEFFARVELHPAMRRAFRRWFSELLEFEPEEADRRMGEVLGDEEIAQHWKDDALVAVLQSSQAGAFLARSGSTLLAEDAVLLRRAGHLLRVACRNACPGALAYSNVGLQPEGPAWDEMPLVVERGITRLKLSDITWILPLLEECVTRGSLEARTEVAIGNLAASFSASLNNVRGRWTDSLKGRILRLMLRVPHTMEAELRKMLDEALSETRLDWENGSLPKLLWDHFSGEEVCRRFPDMTLRVADRRLGFTQAPTREGVRSRGRSYHRLEVEEIFGGRAGSSMDDYPSSAWQGPFANLLTHHPESGLELVIRFINQACATYASLNQDVIEKPKLVALQLEDGRQVSQWANWSLWVMYRAMNVATHALESALMGLEEWLLLKADRGDEDTTSLFSRLLSSSNNVGITAVLASVATAHPYLFGSAAFPLLTCKDFFGWDFSRAFHEATGSSGKGGISQLTLPENVLFEHERRQSSKREHRRFNLEHLCLHLQFTALRERVWAVIDSYLAALPPLDEQNDGHRVWRIRLHGMDARQFKKRQSAEHGVIWQATGLAEDLHEFQQKGQPAHLDRDFRMGLCLWGIKVFGNEDLATARPDLWREKLAAVRGLPPADDESLLLRGSGATHIASVCIRDHAEELSVEERDWCREVVCMEIETPPTDPMWEYASVGRMDPLAPCAVAIPLLAQRETAGEGRVRVLRCLASLVLHPKAEVVQLVAQSIGSSLLATDRPLALSCVAAMLANVSEMMAFREWQQRRPLDERAGEDYFESSQREHEEEAAFDGALRERLFLSIEAGLPLSEGELTGIDYRRHPGLGLLLPLLLLFGERPADPLACIYYDHIAATVVASWAAEGHTRGVGVVEDDRRDDLRFGPRLQAHQLLARFVLTGPKDAAITTWAKLTEQFGDRPEETAEVVKCLSYAEDTVKTGERYWVLWQAVADLYLARSQVDKAEDERSGSLELLDAILLRIDWKVETREWHALRGQHQHILRFADALQPSVRVATGLALLVNRFAGDFLPGALPSVARHVCRTSGESSLSNIALSQLEEAIGGLVYSGAVEIRRNSELRKATLAILDSMVEAGSSAAFRIRDDFVTPLRT